MQILGCFAVQILQSEDEGGFYVFQRAAGVAGKRGFHGRFEFGFDFGGFGFGVCQAGAGFGEACLAFLRFKANLV